MHTLHILSSLHIISICIMQIYVLCYISMHHVAYICNIMHKYAMPLGIIYICIHTKYMYNMQTNKDMHWQNTIIMLLHNKGCI